jgi:hypothetical protein
VIEAGPRLPDPLEALGGGLGDLLTAARRQPVMQADEAENLGGGRDFGLAERSSWRSFRNIITIIIINKSKN